MTAANGRIEALHHIANKPVPPIPSLQTEVSQGDGGVQRIVYSDDGQFVGSAQLLAGTIGDIEVVTEKQRQGYGLRILGDLYARGGRTAFAGSKAGARLMRKAGMRDLGNGRFEFPETTLSPR